MNIKKILVPIDGANLSHKAVQQVANIAQKFNTSIILLVVEDNNYELIFDDDTELENIDHEILVEASRLLSQNIDYKMRVLRGNPKHVIVDYAKKSQSELIVIGATGVSRLSEILIGLTADYVVNHSTCPVFVAR